MPAPRPDQRSRVQLCGRLSVELDGVQVADRLRGRQVRLLLVYLLLNRQRLIARPELISALWPEGSPVSEDAALRTLLSRVRTAVGKATVTGRDQVALTLPEPLWIDLEAARSEFQRAAQALELGDARTAWAVAQVPLNIAGRGLVPGLQAGWLEGTRGELEETRLGALEVIGGAGLAMGGAQLASVERAGRALIEADPYRESGYVLLMQAAARRGNSAAAVRVFERLRGLLRDELGTTPSAEAISVYERVLAPAASEPSRREPARAMSAAPVELPAELQARSGSEMVGRRPEMAELWRLWGSAVRGERHPRPGEEPAGGAWRVVVMSGDAGIGKTSLGGALAVQSHEEGGVVLAGQAVEEGIAPYQPFLDAMRHYFASADLDELGVAIREYGPELARLVPEIRRRVPDLAAPEETEPEGERYRLFEAVVGLLTAISERAPILLLLDDLHWADRATLLLLRHLARAPGPNRLLILIAYRAEAPADSLRDLLADLGRENLVTHLDITGLDESETRELVRLRTGETPSRALSRALHDASEGNPLFIEEILRNLRHAGVEVSTANASVLQEFALPEGVKRMIARRVDRLDPDTVHLLRVAAVIGRDFDLALLEQVGAGQGEDSLRALEAGAAAGVLIEAPDAPGSYEFAHALIREALYEGMSAARRARIHREVGQALEAGKRAPLGELARHFAMAAGREDADRAIRYAMGAAEAAAARLDHEEVVQYYGSALAVLRRFEPDDEWQLLRLLLAYGEACVRAGERARAWEAFREAAEVAERHGDAASLVRAAVGASRRYIQQPGIVEPQVIELLDRALEKTQGDVSGDRVRVLSRLCGALYYSSWRDRLPGLSDEAMQLADQLDDAGAIAEALAARRRAIWDGSRLEERLQNSRRMLTCALRTGDEELKLQARAFLVVDLLELGDRPAADAEMAAFTEAAEQLLQPLYRWNALLWLAMRELLAGRLDRADQAATEALASGAPAETVTAPLYFDAQRWNIRREQLRLAEVELSVARRVEMHPTRPEWRGMLGILLMETGRTEEAGAELAQLIRLDLEALPRDGDWMTTLVMASELSVGLADPESAARLFDLLAPYAEMNVVAGHAVMCLGSVARYLGNLARVLGRSEEAARRLDHALEANTGLNAPLQVAHSRLDYAEALGAGRRAARMVEDAAATARELELPRVGERARRLARR